MSGSNLIIQWSAHRESFTLHGIIARNDLGSMVTACGGRWPYGETRTTFPVDMPSGDHRCDACMARFVEQKFVERGLRELIDNTYSFLADAAHDFENQLKRFNPADHTSFLIWVGPCPHGSSPISRCALGCAPQQQQNQQGEP
jgi:hypothetical protein